MEGNKYVSVSEFAISRGVSKRTVHNWIAAKKLKAKKYGHAFRVDTSPTQSISSDKLLDLLLLSPAKRRNAK
jgi:hypothetical protein